MWIGDSIQGSEAKRRSSSVSVGAGDGRGESCAMMLWMEGWSGSHSTSDAKVRLGLTLSRVRPVFGGS
jgi:hypothetical protein